jgi:hypothetical protein
MQFGTDGGGTIVHYRKLVMAYDGKNAGVDLLVVHFRDCRLVFGTTSAF